MADEPAAGPSNRTEDEAVRVRGARVHNLKNIDVDLPRDKLVVLTGVSGSGKSSLAFDTMFAEGQRRYVESLSTYSRQFLDQLERPDVDAIDGLPPTVSIDQKSSSANPRSTVGTVTEIHDYLRLLYARAGIPHCPSCGQAIRRQTPEQMVNTVLRMGDLRKLLVLAPIVRGRKGSHADAFQAIRRAGLLRARVDGEVVEVGQVDPKLAKTKPHDVEAVVDRLVIREGIRPRLAESLDLALKLGGGTVCLSAQVDGGAWEDTPLSVHFACPSCGTGLEELEPRTFSFNSPYGACPSCHGLGSLAEFDPELVAPDPSRTPERGVLDPGLMTALGPRLAAEIAEWVDGFVRSGDLEASTPIKDWPPAVRRSFLHGENRTPPGEGLLARLQDAYDSHKSGGRKERLDFYRVDRPCPDCGGARLRPEARAVRVGGVSLPELADLSVAKADEFLGTLQWEPGREVIGRPLVQEVRSRLGFLDRVGLGYLTLSRGADTLSGGELQRVRLAGQLGSGLVGVCYLLDEPTAGLHPRDTDLLLETLAGLRDQGNTVIVVEHDEAMIRAADWLIDLGPGAGPDGGEVVALGPPTALRVIGTSLTADHLRRGRGAEQGRSDRLALSPSRVTLRGATGRNLKGIDVEFPTAALTCVAGVSGSGKSTLVLETLVPAVRRALGRGGPRPDSCGSIAGFDAFENLIAVDQSPIGRGPRSTPSTYTGVFDEIRKVFAKTREAKIRGFGPSRFSYNVKGGRCETCAGQGVRKIEMNFLPDLYVVCETCGGQRFNRQTLDVRFKGWSIGDVLGMRVDEGRDVFAAQPRVKRGLDALHEAGLGYVALGQSSTTLSGGEAQRVKLAAELGRSSVGRTLYVLDEPTTGLHFADVDRLLVALHRLVDLGNTVVVIEHNVEVLGSADWLIDLGPVGGEGGGYLLSMGPPDHVAADPRSVTGPFLKGLTGGAR